MKNINIILMLIILFFIIFNLNENNKISNNQTIDNEIIHQDESVKEIRCYILKIEKQTTNGDMDLIIKMADGIVSSIEKVHVVGYPSNDIETKIEIGKYYKYLSDLVEYNEIVDMKIYMKNLRWYVYSINFPSSVRNKLI